MRTFAQKPKTTQPTTSDKSTITSRSHIGQNREVNSILHLQRTIGNQVVERLLQSKTEDLEAGSRAGVSPMRAPTMMLMKQDSGRGKTRSRRARITQQDSLPDVIITDLSDVSVHSVVVGEAGEISLNLRLASAQKGVVGMRVKMQVDNVKSKFLVNYIDVGENPILVIRTVNVPKGKIYVRLSLLHVDGSIDKKKHIAVGKLEISGR